ncbi:MAG: class I SAM-dependent methyltransferase [Acetobacteraceae bacterium]|nr:class I SAM-dependent methyltransferase [Acetobacteraceae bacterium]
MEETVAIATRITIQIITAMTGVILHSVPSGRGDATRGLAGEMRIPAGCHTSCYIIRMSEHVIPFQPNRFEGAAPHYLQGRPPYAPLLFRRVAELIGLGSRHRVLDLGCGPGQLASGFAYFAGSVLAMDPEPEMLAIGAARVEGVLTNVTFLQGSSYDLGPEIGEQFGPFHLAAIGRAFHWMDRADTLFRLNTLIAPDGAVALFTDVHPDVPDNAWMKEFRAIRRRCTDENRADRQPDWPTHETILLASPFCQLERVGVVERRRIPKAQIVDRALSMSSCSRSRLGARVEQLTAEIAALAESAAKEGWIDEVVESVALVAVRQH